MITPRAKISILIGLLLFFVFVEIYFTKNHFLDDAFIHLRIAENLIDNGFYSFNGLSEDFSTSSPLYTGLLAALSSVHRTPYLPKIVNLVVYFIVLSVLIRAVTRSRENKQLALLFTSLILLSSPFGIRWLTDGMETGLVVLFAILLSMSMNRLTQEILPRKQTLFFISLISGMSVLLRVEFGYILAVIVFSLATQCFYATKSDTLSSFKCTARKSLPILVGGAFGAVILNLFVISVFNNSE
jgi:hypothetical protein